jgi:hypothetical protein
VLVACEFSGLVRDAFDAAGHDAVSVDLLDSERPGMHMQGDVLDVLYDWRWDMMIAFPPCTHLANSGAQHRAWSQMERGLAFVRTLMEAPIDRIAIENPVGAISTHIRRPDQIIQPWMFGHPETKATCLWLKNLPPLQPSDLVIPVKKRIHLMPQRLSRSRDRSRTYEGVAEAMAEQWGRAELPPIVRTKLTSSQQAHEPINLRAIEEA